MIIEIKNGRKRKRQGYEHEYATTAVINLNQITSITQVYEEFLHDSECGIEGDGCSYVEQDSIIHFVDGTNLRVEETIMDQIKEKL